MSFVFDIDGKHVKCFLTKSHLIIGEDENDRESIDIADIIAVEEGEPYGDEITGINLFRIQQAEGFHLRNKKITLRADKDTCKKFKDALQSKIDELEGRPKRLLVLISPVAGAHQGEQVYKDVVGPIFDLAGIKTETIVSEYPDHIKDLMKTYDTDKVDGFVVFGGDGSYNQCIIPLLERAQTEAGINYHNSTSELAPTTKPIGFIPTGTRSASARVCHGCVDVETAALHIVKGCKTKLGISAVYSEDKCVGFFTMLVGFGLSTELFHYTEGFRWLKTMRYLVIPVYYYLFKAIPVFKGDIKMLLRTERTNSATDEQPLDAKVDEAVRFIDLLWFPFDFLDNEITMASKTWKDKVSFARLYTHDYSSRIGLLRNLMVRLFNNRKDYVNPSFVKEYNIAGYKIKLDTSAEQDTQQTYRILLDGEYI